LFTTIQREPFLVHDACETIELCHCHGKRHSAFWLRGANTKNLLYSTDERVMANENEPLTQSAIDKLCIRTKVMVADTSEQILGGVPLFSIKRLRTSLRSSAKRSQHRVVRRWRLI